MRGETVLHQAAYYGHEAVVQVLVDNGADVEAEGLEGETALHQAAYYGPEAMVRLLVENGADVTATSDGGETALHQAAMDGHDRVARLLVGKAAGGEGSRHRGEIWGERRQYARRLGSTGSSLNQICAYGFSKAKPKDAVHPNLHFHQLPVMPAIRTEFSWNPLLEDVQSPVFLFGASSLFPLKQLHLHLSLEISRYKHRLAMLVSVEGCSRPSTPFLVSIT